MSNAGNLPHPAEATPEEIAVQKAQAEAEEEAELERAARQGVAAWLKTAEEAEWLSVVLESTDPIRSLHLAIAALKNAKAGESPGDQAKLERFALEVQDVLARLAANEAVRHQS